MDLDLWQSPYTNKDYYADLSTQNIDWKRIFLQKRVTGIRRYRQSGHVLELGAGLGETALAMAHAGFRVDAVEESQKTVSYLKTHHPLVTWHQSDIKHFLEHAPDANYDVIMMFHVLEHIPHPKQIIQELSRVLMPDGILVVEVPNLAGLHARIKGEHWHYFLPHHVNYFCLATLRHLMEPQGFTLLEHEGKFHFSHPQGVWWKDTLKFILAKVGFADILCTWWQRENSHQSVLS
ncbi:MAG: class I SAM-dependent methyltransferase [Magnetococcus sp. DMHC-1]|nr:class I SAM-dependent methyltransferase [Magnetococcales bacterium]